jgi:hypothetical protein
MIIHCSKKFIEAIKYANSINDSTLEKCLESFENWEKRTGGTVELYKDKSPLSFLFCRKINGEVEVNGGLIYHGNPDESFSFQIEKSTGWQVHT